MGTASYSAEDRASPFQFNIYLPPKSASKRRVTETWYNRLRRKSLVRAYHAARWVPTPNPATVLQYSRSIRTSWIIKVLRHEYGRHINYSIHQSPILEASNSLAKQEIPRILWKPQFRWRARDSPPFQHFLIREIQSIFYVHGFVHRESVSINVQQDATIYSFIIFSSDSSTCFGWYLHPSSGALSNCNCNIWHWSNGICYRPLTWRSRNGVPTPSDEGIIRNM